MYIFSIVLLCLLKSEISLFFAGIYFIQHTVNNELLFSGSATAFIQVFFLTIYTHTSPIRRTNRVIPDPAEGVVVGDVDFKVPTGIGRVRETDT